MATLKRSILHVQVKASGWAERSEELTMSFRAVIMAIGPLEWEDKRRILRWAADLFSVDPKAL